MDDVAKGIIEDPSDEEALGRELGRRRRALDHENRPTRILSDSAMVHDLLDEAHKLALTRTTRDTLELAVRALCRHTRSQWAAAWRFSPAGEIDAIAKQGVDRIPDFLYTMIDRHRQTCVWDEEGAYCTSPLVATPIMQGDRVVGAIAIQMDECEAVEDDLLTLEFLAALCAVGQEHGQQLTLEERQRQVAEEAKQNQSDFLSMVSHDVRSPLSIIKSYAQMIIDLRKNFDEEEQDELLGKVIEQAERIERLVNGLLDVAKSDSGRLELDLEEGDIRHVIERAVGLVDVNNRYELRMPENEMVAKIDRLRIEQIVANLVSNALKYGKDPFIVQVEDMEDTWSLVVSDGGEGLPSNIEENLFQRFVPGAKKVGLGLSIVQALVIAHGGAITYRRSEEDGQKLSSFVISFPKL